jgi:hypothetical protein
MDETHAPETPRGLKETMGAENIGFQKGRSILNTAVHMSFRREVNDRVEPMLKDFMDSPLVSDVATHKVISVILCNLHKVFDVSRVGKLVEVKEFDIGPIVQYIPHKIRTYEASSAGNEDFHSVSPQHNLSYYI